MKKFLKWAGIGLLSLVVLAFLVFYVWASSTFGPTEELRGLVDVERAVQKEAAVFEPAAEERNGVGVILYPGAKVENAAYSYYAEGLMKQGYTVIVPAVRFNFALFDTGKANRFMEDYEDVEHWVIGGHSLGGVAAAMYAAEHDVAGLVFLGAYPSGTTDLTQHSFPVLSLYAEFDGLTLLEDIEASKALLPEHAVYAEIKGGNHAQFGMYGEQNGDLAPEISAVEQQEQMIALTLQWLSDNGL